MDHLKAVFDTWEIEARAYVMPGGIRSNKYEIWSINPDRPGYLFDIDDSMSANNLVSMLRYAVREHMRGIREGQTKLQNQFAELMGLVRKQDD
jgi:hypothetical protein